MTPSNSPIASFSLSKAPSGSELLQAKRELDFASESQSHMTPPPRPLPSLKATADVDGKDDDGEVQVIDPFRGVTLADVVVSEEASNPLPKPNKKLKTSPTYGPSQLTKLVSVNGVASCFLRVKELRPWMRLQGIKVSQANPTKKQCCDAIAAAKLNPPKPKKKTGPKFFTPNKKRYINVLFSDKIRPLIAKMGEPLNKDELTAGLTTDETIHRTIVQSYNNEELHNDCYFKTAGKTIAGDSSDPADFAGPLIWTQSKTLLRDLTKDYEKNLNNWKASGSHGGFSDIKPFESFVHKDLVPQLYLHEYAHAYPEILQKTLKKLPAGVFSESIRKSNPESNVTETVTPASNKKKKRQTNAATNEAALAEYNRNAEKRNAAFKTNNYVSSLNKVNTFIQEQKDRKRDFFKAAMEATRQIDDKNNKRAMKRRYKNFAKARIAAGKDCDSSSDSEEDVDLLTDSQESKFKVIMACESNINSYKEMKKNIEDEMKTDKEN